MQECVICCEDINNNNTEFTSYCNHNFHHSCITRWCQHNNSCPTCRAQNIMTIQKPIVTDNNYTNNNNYYYNYNYNNNINQYINNIDNYINNVNNISIVINNYINSTNNNTSNNTNNYTNNNTNNNIINNIDREYYINNIIYYNDI